MRKKILKNEHFNLIYNKNNFNMYETKRGELINDWR